MNHVLRFQIKLSMEDIIRSFQTELSATTKYSKFMRSRLALQINYSKCKRSDSVSQITANVRTIFELFEWSLPVLILAFGSDSKFSLLDIFHYGLCLKVICQLKPLLSERPFTQFTLQNSK